MLPKVCAMKVGLTLAGPPCIYRSFAISDVRLCAITADAFVILSFFSLSFFFIALSHRNLHELYLRRNDHARLETWRQCAEKYQLRVKHLFGSVINGYEIGTLLLKC